MADEVVEQTPTEEAPYFAVDKEKGRVFIEGVDVTHLVNPDASRTEAEEEPEEPQGSPDNAQVEGKEPEPPKEEAKEEPKEEEKPPEEPPKEPEPEKPKGPDKWKFKLKFRGKEEDVEYDPVQVQVRLNKLRAFEENEKEFWERNKRLEPFLPIIESDWFRQKVAEAYETGELEKPPAPPPVPMQIQYEIMKRQAEPDHAEILNELREYAMRLPPEAARMLDSDPTVFLPEYDRVAKDRRERLEKMAAKPEPPKATPEEIKKKLEHKEAVKKAAVVTPPGVQGEQASPLKSWEKRERELVKQLRDPANQSRHLQIAAELLVHRDSKPT